MKVGQPTMSNTYYLCINMIDNMRYLLCSDKFVLSSNPVVIVYLLNVYVIIQT